MTDFTTSPATAEEYEWARRVILSNVQDPDFMGVAEFLGDEWEGLTEEEFDERHRRVHDLAGRATVTVSWSDAEGEARADNARDLLRKAADLLDALDLGVGSDGCALLVRRIDAYLAAKGGASA